MIWVIEFRSGSYLQQNGLDSGTLTGAKRFDSRREANQHINLHEWLAINGGMAKEERMSGSEVIPGDAVMTFQLFSGEETPPEELAVAIHKLRDAPMPNLEERVTFEVPQRHHRK